MDPATQALRDAILAAAAQKTALRIRGGCSKDFLSPTRAAPVLDTRDLRGIISYEPSELVVTVRAGTPLAELEAALAEQSQYLAFEPPHFDWRGSGAQGTVGGMVAAGLSGPARANAGSVRDYVLGAQLLNGRGELLQFGGTVMKNVAGYDVSRLLAGSWGSLGVLTQVSLKVQPVAPAQATLEFALDAAAALAKLHRWGAQPLPLNASCWTPAPVAPSERLRLRLRGAQAAVESACQRLLAEVPGQRLDAMAAERFWNDVRHLRSRFFHPPAEADQMLWRLSLPQTTPMLELPWPQQIEWHGAQRWLWANAAAAPVLHAAAQKAGGQASLFYAPQGTQLPRHAPLPDVQARIQRQIQAEFDPAGLFS